MKKHGPASVITALAILTAALVAAPAAAAATWYLPGASETPGQNAAYYSSTLWVTNTGTSPASVEFRFIPFAGTAAASPVVRTLQAGETREYEEVLPTLFTLARGAGTIVLVTDGSVVATMSTANTADPKGTFGLAVRPVAESELAGAGARHEVVFASHKADLKTASRTNVSAVLVDPNTSFTVVAYDPAGAELGRKTISSATPVHWQESLGPIVGEKDVPLGRVSFEVASGRIAVYDSVVDNVTNDGFVIQGVPSTQVRSQWLLAGMSRAPGERNTFWTSDVWVHNPQATAIQVTFTPWLAGAAPFTKSVGAKGILQVADIVGAGGFGLERGSGVVEVRSDSPFFVESRTYNSDPANPAAGTYSATVRAFTEDLLVRGPGQAAVNAAEASDAFRTNLTLFSPTGGALALKLLDQQGTEISRTTANLGAKTSWQQSLAGWFSTGSSSVGTLSVPAGFKGTVVVDVPAGVLFQGYVSRVDNGTGDGMAPSFTPIQSCAPPAITSFTATPSSSTAGASVILALASTGCVSAKVTPGDLPIPCNGTITVTPTQTTEYTATATGGCEPAAISKVSVNIGCPAISVRADAQGPADFCEEGSVTLAAVATNCASCEYDWYRNGSPVGSGRTFEATAAGNYTVRARDGAGCSATSSPVSVVVRESPTAIVGNGTTICAGGSAQITATLAGAPPFTGQWSDGTPFQTSGFSLSRTVSPATTTAYSIAAIQDLNCTGVASGLATVSVSPSVDATITAPATVGGGSTGNAASVPNAGAGATYAWTITNGTITAGQGTAAITFTAGATGTVSLGVTVTSATGCTASGTKSVGVDCTPPSATITTPTEVCASATGQAASVPDAGAGATYAWTITNGTITGGAGTRAITWSAGATGPVQLSATVTIGAGCSNSGNASVTVNLLPTITGVGISANPVEFGNFATISFTLTNATSWTGASSLGNGISPSGGTGSGAKSVIYSADSATGIDTVTITATNACGTITQTLTVGVCGPPSATITAQASVCPNAAGNAASVPAAGTGATYTWGITNGTITAGSGTNAITWTAGAAGPVGLTVAVQNAEGCSSTGNASVTVNPLPTISGVGISANPVGAGNSATISFTLTNAVSWTISSSLGNGVTPPSGTGSGAKSVTYSADNNTGTDTVTITATNACGDTVQTLQVVVCSPPSATITAQASVCPNAAGNAASVPAAGTGATYTWGITNGTITAGSGTNAITWTAGAAGPVGLTVAVQNAEGCSSTGNASVTVNPLPVGGALSASPSTITENGSSLITFNCTNCTSVSIISTPGNSISVPVQVNATTWQATFTDTQGANAYTINASGTNSCGSSNATNIATIQVTFSCTPPAAIITPSGPTSFCEGGNVTLTASPAGMSYLWSTGATTQSITTGTTGSYTVTVTSGPGCSNTSAPTVVTVNPNPLAPTISASGPTTFCAGNSVTLTASGGYAGYLWSTGATTQSITVSGSGNYTVRGTNATGCQSPVSTATTITVTPNPVATISAGGPTTFCEGGNVVLTASAGSSYLWFRNGISIGAVTQSYTASTSGSYTVQVTNASGCSDLSDPTVVTVTAPLVATISAGGPTTFCAGGSVTLTAFPAGMSYAWSTGATTQSVTVSSSNNYSVVVTNGSGCSDASDPVAVTVNPLPSDVITAPSSVCPLTADYTASVPFAGPGSTYAWTVNNANITSGQGTFNITYDTASVGPVTINVTVTSASGCSNSSTVNVPMNPLPTVSVSVNPSTIAVNGTATVTITCTNCTSWSLSNDQGDPIAPASGVGSGTFTATYTSAAGPAFPSTITATGTNGCGSTQASTSLTITP